MNIGDRELAHDIFTKSNAPWKLLDELQAVMAEQEDCWQDKKAILQDINRACKTK